MRASCIMKRARSFPRRCSRRRHLPPPPPLCSSPVISSRARSNLKPPLPLLEFNKKLDRLSTDFSKRKNYSSITRLKDSFLGFWWIYDKAFFLKASVGKPFSLAFSSDNKKLKKYT